MRVPADLSHLQIPSSATTHPRRICAYSAWVVGAASTLSASHRSIHLRNSMVGGRGNARDELGSIAAYTRAKVTNVPGTWTYCLAATAESSGTGRVRDLTAQR